MKIKDIGRVVTGKTPLTGVNEYYGGNIMFISPSDLHGDYLIEKSEKTITEEGLKSIESNSIDGISVLTGCIGWDMGNVAMCNSTFHFLTLMTRKWNSIRIKAFCNIPDGCIFPILRNISI